MMRKSIIFTILFAIIAIPLFAQAGKTQMSIYGGLGRYQELATINEYGMTAGLEYHYYATNKFYLTGILHTGYVKGRKPAKFTGNDNVYYEIEQSGKVFNSMLGMGLGMDFLKLADKHRFYIQIAGGLAHYENERTVIKNDRPTPDIYKYWGEQEREQLTNFAFISTIGYDYSLTNNIKIGVAYTFFDIALKKENDGLNIKLSYLF